METEFSKQYPFITTAFSQNNIDYNVVIAPIYYEESGELDFTGGYTCLVISSLLGTRSFDIDSVDDETEWGSTIIPDEAVKIIIEKIKVWRKAG